jgi:acetyl/propionyl-CoA carboxylase alpha subunit
MTGYRASINGVEVDAATGWRLTWLEPATGAVRLTDGTTAITAVVEGAGEEWWVTLRGRRIGVTVRSWRERTLAQAEAASGTHAGPTEVKATLPGLVVTLEVTEGTEVVEDQPLLTLEAMKMQNEVRAPRAGRVTRVAVAAGQAVATGQLLVRIE